MARSRYVSLIVVSVVAITACSSSQDEPTESRETFAIAPADGTLSPVSPGTASNAPTTPADLVPAEAERVESVEGTMVTTVPGSWGLDASGVEQRATTAGVEDVLGVWNVDTVSGDHRVTVEADAQGDRVFDAQGYFDAFFANTDAGLGQEVEHEFFTAADGSRALWITATADQDSSAADEVAFFLFSGERIVVGRAAATTTMDQGVATQLRAIGAELTP